MKPPRFYAPDAQDGVARVTLSRDEAHHLTHVLRLRAGADVRVFNGDGGEWAATVASVSRHEAELAITGPAAPAAEPAIHVTLGVGVLKGDQMDVVVRDATALGVAVIAPFTSAHVTVPSHAWATGAAIGRWRKIAIASAKQCGRAVVPAIVPVVSLAHLLQTHSAGLLVMCVEPALAESRKLELPSKALGLPSKPPASVLALIGPEGGWSADEVESAAAAGAHLTHLGPRTLRAEIAPTVLLSSLWTRWER